MILEGYHPPIVSLLNTKKRAIEEIQSENDVESEDYLNSPSLKTIS